jgi:hypothetical protein
MYGPLEEKSGSIYRSRKIIEHVEKDGKTEDVSRWVDQTPRWDELENIAAKNKAKAEAAAEKKVTDMAEEKKDAIAAEEPEVENGEEAVTTAHRMTSYESIRSMDKEAHFLLVEFMTHVRYLIDFMFMNEEEVKYYKHWMGLKTDDYHSYLFDVCLSDYKRIKVLEFSKLDDGNYFIGMNILILEKIFPMLSEKITNPRNEIEKDMKAQFEQIKPNFNSNVSVRAAMMKELNSNMENSTTLIKNWVNRMASIDDLQQKSSDIKLISGMRMEKQIDIENLKEFLNSKLIAYEEAGEEKKKELAQIKFIIYVIGFEDILTILQELLYSHVDLANYLEHVFDFRVSYKMACSINMKELISSEIDETLNTIPENCSEEEAKFLKHRKLMIQRCNGDEILAYKFEKVKTAWTKIMKYREQYAESFAFRFLCHAEEMPQEKIDLILGDESKLIYFLPNEKYVESLFMSATLQTLAKIQNKVIEDHPHQYFRANYTRPRKTGVQVAKKSEIVNLSTSFLDVINKCSYANLTFNKDGELVYNIDMIERELSLDLFFGKKRLMFEEKYIRNFNFSREFNEINTSVQTVAMKFGQTFMDKPESDYIQNAIQLSTEETMAIFARKLKELSYHEFDLNLIKGVSDNKDEFVIQFENDYLLDNGE